MAARLGIVLNWVFTVLAIAWIWGGLHSGVDPAWFIWSVGGALVIVGMVIRYVLAGKP